MAESTEERQITLTQMDLDALIVGAQVLPGEKILIDAVYNDGVTVIQGLRLGTEASPVYQHPNDMVQLQTRGWRPVKHGYAYTPGSNTHMPKPRPGC